jgi:hypothetical protein
VIEFIFFVKTGNDVHTTKSKTIEGFYYLKVLAHFRSKRTGGFCTIHKLNVPMARLRSKTSMTKRIYLNCAK